MRLQFEVEPEVFYAPDVSPDGQSFVMIEKDAFELRPLDLVIVPEWREELDARLSAPKR